MFLLLLAQSWTGGEERIHIANKVPASDPTPPLEPLVIRLLAGSEGSYTVLEEGDVPPACLDSGIMFVQGEESESFVWLITDTEDEWYVYNAQNWGSEGAGFPVYANANEDDWPPVPLALLSDLPEQAANHLHWH